MRPLAFRIASASVLGVAAIFSAVVVAPPASAGGPLSLRVCTTGDYAPLTYRDPVTGQYRGIDIDMATDLAAHLGRGPVFIATTWATLAQDVTTPGRCDIAMGGINVTAARQQIAEFTAPYLDSGKVPLTARANAGAFESIDEINAPGVQVIENGGGTNEQFARQRQCRCDGHRCARGGLPVRAASGVGGGASRLAVHRGAQGVHVAHGSPLTRDVDAWLTQTLGNGTFSRIRSLWMS